MSFPDAAKRPRTDGFAAAQGMGGPYGQGMGGPMGGGPMAGEAGMMVQQGPFMGDHPMQIEMALAKNRSYMGRRYIEIYKAKKLDYYKAICADLMDGGPMGGMNRWRGGEDGGLMAGYGRQPGGPYGVGPAGGPGGPAAGYSQALPSGAAFDAATGGSGGTTILKLRGLPFSVGDDDICQWFNEDKTLGIAPVVKDKCVGRGDGQGVLVVMDHGRPSGVAFVEFMSPAEATAAMAKNKQMMGSRYVEIFPATRADLDRCMQQA
ncbi:hypothetical protein QJQ45_005788 [Haematococcus lacustris]|nr:hypothetical protein QJQ45_005788 [Haematococcus lacustris]